MALALFGAACADEEPTGTGGDDGGVEEVDFTACQVTDTGGVDDKSFNQTAFEGMQRAEEELGIKTKVLESQSDADFEPNINTFLNEGCDLIVTVGFLLGDATLAAAEANPDQKFAIVDVDFFDFEAGEDITLDNARELTFSTDQAAFLAGVLASGMSESGVLGTFGGINIPPVTIFENGFEAGMNWWNSEAGAAVELKGWSSAKQDGLFTGDFEDLDKGKQVTQQLLDEGADVIMPVAGPVGLGAAEAARDAGATMIWVDTDGCVSAADFCDLFLTSVQKKMDNAVFDTIKAALEDTFEGGLYVGTLENDGVGIAPYHEFDSVIPDALKQTVEEVKAGIIDGSISVTG